LKLADEHRGRGFFRAVLSLGLILTLAAPAFCDIVGQLHFTVKDVDTEKPIANAKIVLSDSAGVHAPISLKTDDKGEATSDPLTAHVWGVKTTADGYKDDQRNVTVIRDTTTNVDVELESSSETVITVKGQRVLVKQTDTSSETVLTQKNINLLPRANPASLTQLILTQPGFVADSVQQAHPRGEHSATTLYIQGLQLGGAFQGRAGQILSPTSIQDMDVELGGFAPEYGSETAAVINLTLRSGTINPFTEFEMQGGGYDTAYAGLTFGGQGGAKYGLPNDQGDYAKRFTYMVDLSGRSTTNALESPQPDDQTANNGSQAYTGLGHFTYQSTDKDLLDLTLSAAPAHTGVANRTGLPASFAPYGQGYGFGGALGPSSGLGTQEQDGQDDYQNDRNDFGVLAYRHTFNDHVSSVLSIGAVQAGLDVLNHNPAVAAYNRAGLPADNSIEYNPTIIRNSHNSEIQGSVTVVQGQHNYKVGAIYDDESGQESYELDPASQAAWDALAGTDMRLLPTGNAPSTLYVGRSGYYAAAYAQDTYQASSRFTLNYGLRFDAFRQREEATGTYGGDDVSTVDKDDISPRFNASYEVAKATILRASADHLFIQPNLSQGSFLGTQIKPETLNQYELSIERQMAANQVVKFSAYYKDIHDQIDTGLLIGGTQIGVYTSDQFDRDHVRGLELSYNLTPSTPVGYTQYVAISHSIAQPAGLTNTGDPAPQYNDHDQLNTINLGGAYAFESGINASWDWYFGSGVESSKVNPDGTRTPRNYLNLALSSGDKLLGGHTSLTLSVENVFDSTTLINFNSGFSGTRFQQGRRVLLSLNTKF